MLLSIKANILFLLNLYIAGGIIAADVHYDMKKVVIKLVNVVYCIGPLELHGQALFFRL
jgi:hypothetical protein